MWSSFTTAIPSSCSEMLVGDSSGMASVVEISALWSSYAGSCCTGTSGPKGHVTAPAIEADADGPMFTDDPGSSMPSVLLRDCSRVDNLSYLICVCLAVHFAYTFLSRASPEFPPAEQFAHVCQKSDMNTCTPLTQSLKDSVCAAFKETSIFEQEANTFDFIYSIIMANLKRCVPTIPSTARFLLIWKHTKLLWCGETIKA